jgi:hypothetical protein
VNVSALRNKARIPLSGVADASVEGTKDALVRELQWLRRGEGLTLRKLASAPTLLCLASSLGRAGAQAEDEAIFAADRLLRLELTNLGDGLGARALRAALALEGEDPRTLTSRARLLTSTGLPATASLVHGHRELLDSLLAVVHGAEECLVASGSRSRDPDYLQTIENRLASTAVVHYRVLCGPPHWSVLKSHLLRLQEMRSGSIPGGDPRILIGLLSDFRREPERFICANERRAVLILPSLNGLEHYDTGLDLDGEQYGMAYVRLVQEMYAASQPVETESDILALPLVRE